VLNQLQIGQTRDSKEERTSASTNDANSKGGKNLIDLITYRRELLEQWKKRGGTFWFAGMHLPYEAATTHLLYVGSTGSGKTVSQRMLYQTTLAPTIGQHLSHRCLAFDPKGDLHRILFGMGIPRNCVRTLNPFDTRSSVWDMAADVTDEATAFEVSGIFIPEAQEQQPFFRYASRDIFTGVTNSKILSYQKTGNRWTLSDVLYPLFKKDNDLLKATLAKHEETEDRLQYFKNKETADNIISTLRAMLRPFQTIAALWDEAEREGERERTRLGLESNPRLVSLEAWARDTRGEILILGNSQKLQNSLRLVNQVIFKRASQILLSLPELQKGMARRTWICLDEVRALQHLEGLQDLLTQGRSKGICVVLGFQSIEGMRDKSVWGEQIAHELTGQCRNKAFFGVGDEATAKWIAGNFGEIERPETSVTVSSSKSSRNLDIIETTQTESTSETTQKVKREVVLSNELLTMPPTDEKHGLRGFYVSPHFWTLGTKGAFRQVHIPAKDIFNGQLQKLSAEDDNFESNLRPSSHQRMKGRTNDSYCAKFGIVIEGDSGDARRSSGDAGRPAKPPFVTEN
jgi:hypothetical protein